MFKALKKKAKEKSIYKENPAYPKVKKGKIKGETPEDEQAEMMDMGKC